MAHRPTPRPDFEGPTHIPYEDSVRYLWGDEESGRVADWYYVSNENIHCMAYAMSEGGSFTHSEDYPTCYGADEVMIVLTGALALANPETGEVVRVEAGEAVFFRKDTWHHGFNVGEGEVRVLEYFAPPPETGTGSVDHAERTEYLEESEWSYHPAALTKQWPTTSRESIEQRTLYSLHEDDILLTIKGRETPVLTGLYADTEHLRSGYIELRPGQRTDPASHGGDEVAYVSDGTIFINLPEQVEDHWFELSPDDGFYIPEGVEHGYHNRSGETVRLYFGIAPNDE